MIEPASIKPDDKSLTSFLKTKIHLFYPQTISFAQILTFKNGESVDTLHPTHKEKVNIVI